MILNRLLQLIFGATLVAAQSNAPTTPTTPILLDEYLTHKCALSVGRLNQTAPSNGPVFAIGDLAVTSTLASDGTQLLIAASPAGTFMIPLPKLGVNRIRFEIPGHSVGTYFLSYSHGHRPRVYEFSTPRPPMGKDELDYLSLTATRAPALVNHLNYAILETATSMGQRVASDGPFAFENTSNLVSSCDQVERISPRLAGELRRNLELIASSSTVLQTASSRMPASLRQ